MFSKLLKYEWKSNAKLLWILSICALGAGVMGTLVTRLIVYLDQNAQQVDTVILGTMGLGSILAFIVVALIAYLLAVQFINLFRFYKSRFTDQGYLTFTLPVTPHQIFLSSFLNILFWMLISFAVFCISGLMIAVIGAWDLWQDSYINADDIIDIGQSLDDVLSQEPGYRLNMILTVVGVVIEVLYSIFLIMTCITLGCVIARKGKIFLTIGLYYGITMGVSAVESVLAFIPLLAISEFYESYYIFADVVLCINMAMQIGLAVGGYFLSTSMMKNKLNLP
ncbi:MAG: hypothetical protein E7438_06110 [Ruminococcaceae bacterium]|nr:hypothetical protein [Oscillospiraceae bacterium]